MKLMAFIHDRDQLEVVWGKSTSPHRNKWELWSIYEHFNSQLLCCSYFPWPNCFPVRWVSRRLNGNGKNRWQRSITKTQRRPAVPSETMVSGLGSGNSIDSIELFNNFNKFKLFFYVFLVLFQVQEPMRLPTFTFFTFKFHNKKLHRCNCNYLCQKWHAFFPACS